MFGKGQYCIFSLFDFIPPILEFCCWIYEIIIEIISLLLNSSLPNTKRKKCYADHNATLYIACRRRLKFKFFP